MVIEIGGDYVEQINGSSEVAVLGDDIREVDGTINRTGLEGDFSEEVLTFSTSGATQATKTFNGFVGMALIVKVTAYNTAKDKGLGGVWVISGAIGGVSQATLIARQRDFVTADVTITTGTGPTVFSIEMNGEAGEDITWHVYVSGLRS